MRRRRPPSRLSAAALAALWLALPLGALLHSAHTHQLCAEHGKLEEGSQPHSSAPDEAQVRAPEAHQGCAVLAALNSPAAAQPSVTAVLPRIPQCEHLAAGAHLSFEPLAPLTRAPKASPPRRA